MGEWIMGKVTLKDIARETGMSINTVSRVMNKSEFVADKTRELIERVANEMGYVANAAAKELRTGESRNIALILDDLINPHFSILADEISMYAFELNYNVFVYTTSGIADREKRVIMSALSRGVAGIIMCPTRESYDNIELLKKTGIPFILIEHTYEKFKECSYVVYDETRIGVIAAECLIMDGHRKVLTVLTDECDSFYKQRVSGIIQAHRNLGLNYKDESIFYLPSNFRSQYRELKRIIEENIADYSAVICYNDIIAMQTIDIVGEDIAVMGFGNIGKKLSIKQSFHTIDTARDDISICAFDELLKLIKGEEKIVEKILPVKLV